MAAGALAAGLGAVPAPAQAAAVDVVGTVRGLHARGASVKIEQVFIADAPDDTREGTGPSTGRNPERAAAGYHVKASGIARLSRTGIAASEVRRLMTFGDPRRRQFLRDDAANGDRRSGDVLAQIGRRHRLRSVGGATYGFGPAYGGGSWRRLGRASGADALYGDQIVNIFEPGTLRTLVATATVKERAGKVFDADDRSVWSYAYQGTITFARLFQVSPSFREMLGGRLAPRYRNIKVLWRISTDLKGRPVVVQTQWRPGPGHPLEAVHGATRYSWDVRAKITAPRATRAARVPFADDLTDHFACRTRAADCGTPPPGKPW